MNYVTLVSGILLSFIGYRNLDDDTNASAIQVIIGAMAVGYALARILN